MAAAKRRSGVCASPGSIGVSTLDVIDQLGGRHAFDVLAITGSSNIPLRSEQARASGARLAVTADESRYADLKDALAGSGTEAAAGREALVDRKSTRLNSSH